MTKKYLIIVCSLLIYITGCKKWEDHTSINNPALGENIFQQISKKANLSKFAELLVKSGLDKELGSSKSYTVWAPSNDALQSLDPAIVNDTAKLKKFVGNHISTQSYTTAMAQASMRVPLLNGKKATFQNRKFDESNITEADNLTSNGVLHILDKFNDPKPNAWEFLNSTSTQFQQSAFIITQNFKARDLSNAIIDSISSTTGQPVYKPGTDSSIRNRFIDQVADLKNEDKLYTFFILNDAALAVEVDSLKTFYKTSSTDSTLSLAMMSVVKDMVLEGVYSIDQLNSNFISKFGVPIPVNKNDVTATYKLSNGVAYVLNKLDFPTKDKIRNILVNGEFPSGFFNAAGDAVNVRGSTFYRVRTNLVTGKIFNDIFVYNHGIANLNILYQAFNVPAAKYKVYWVAVNDTITVSTRINPVAFQQRLLMGSRTATTFPAVSVTPNNFNEVYLGEYIQPSFGRLDMFLTAANSTTGGTNSLTLDYIRLEPQF